MNSKNALQVGSSVELNSGDGKMTITHIDSKNIATCVWFDRDKKVREHQFSLSCLREHSALPLVEINIGADIPGLEHLQRSSANA